MPGLSVPAERSGCRSKPSRFRSGARNPAVELSDSLFDRGVVVNPRVEIARPIGTLFITPETGAQSPSSGSSTRSIECSCVPICVKNNEYERNGTANIFMFCEPLRGWRHVNVTHRRTKVDFALQIKELLEVHYPDAECVRLVMDNLNTHALSSLYEAFEPTEARMLVERLEIIHTPKHGSWLNIAEIELTVLARQCLSRRIPDQPTLGREIAAWESSRNANEAPVDWQFTTDDARIKLRRLYPKTQP